MLLTQLADVAYRTGRPVVEVPGWRTRTTVASGMTGVKTVACHHTGSTGRGEMSTTLLVEGRPGLGGPLSQYGIGRSGAIYVIAAGRCSHAGQVLAPRFANEFAVGIEAMNDGLGEPWGDAVMTSYRLLCVELIAEFGLTASDVRGHKEIAAPLGRKVDPSFDMDGFRATLSAQPVPATPALRGPTEMHTCSYAGTVWLIDGAGYRRKVPNPEFHGNLKRGGAIYIGDVSKDYLGWFPYATSSADQTAAILAAITAAQTPGATAEQIAAAVIAEIAS